MGHKEKYTGGHVMLKMSLSLSQAPSAKSLVRRRPTNRNIIGTHTHVYIYIIYIHTYIYINAPFFEETESVHMH
jgi:hypothetical protein